MLKEYPSSQREPKLRRRWFSDDSLDLIVWFNARREIRAFQICYGKPYEEHAVAWSAESGFFHSRIDDGEENPGKNKTPVFGRELPPLKDRLLGEFRTRSQSLSPLLSRFILEKLESME
ncbi:MAG: hypothetical protein SFY92_07180 [Verrucomicrobiae bacterium]|nr:hypothetical protein [Verrucomicrobiae bacterium]